MVTKVDYCSSVLSGISTATVSLRRRRSSRLLGEEVGAHNSTPPWTTLAESSGENSVPVMCIAALTARRRHTSLRPGPPDYRRRFTSASSECFSVDAGCTVHTTHHAGWSSLPGSWCLSVECSSAVCSTCHRCCSSALQLCRWQFSHKENFVADFLQAKCYFTPKTAALHFWALFGGGLGATYDDHLRLIGSVYFLLVISLSVTAEALRASICSKSAISLQPGLVDPKFQIEGVAPPPTILLIRKE